MDDPEERGLGSRLSPFEDVELDAQHEAARVTDRRAFAGSLLGLALLIGFHALQAAQWARSNSVPPAWDQAVQLESAWDVRTALAKGDWHAALHVAPKPGMPPFPPLYQLSLQPILSASDPAADVAWVNWAYLALLCLGLWGLGRHFMGEWEGLGAAVLLSCTPQVGWLAREALVDLPLMAWVACAYWALAASDGFRRKGPSALFGALFSAAMLTKWSAFSYFLPALVPAYTALAAGAPGGVLAAAGTAALLCAPWYVPELPVLLPRLVGAAGDQAVPVWSGGAVFAYVPQMAAGLELPLFVLGALGLVVPSMRKRTEDSWLLPAWFLSALVFWTVVPNRQLRYLMPGIVPLAVLAMGPWPRGVRPAVCALALLSAWNYPRGVLPALRLDAGIPLALFSSEKPRREDWRLGEILRAAEGMRDPSEPFADLAFVANHPSLNGPVLNWERKRLGLDGLRIRGVTKRYTELCEFVLVKTGSLGPDSVTGQLPDVQRVTLDPSRWFQRGWAEARRWALPDGTSAVLFQRRRLRQAPAGTGREDVDYYEEGSFRAEGLSFDFGVWDAPGGYYPRVSVRAKNLTLRGLKVSGVALALRDVAFVSADESKTAHPDPLSEPRFTRLDGVALEGATVSEDDLAAFIARRVKGLSDVTAKMDHGVVSAAARWHGVPLSVSLAPRLLPNGAGLAVTAREASIAGLPLPLGLFGARRFALPFAPSGELPFRVSLRSLSVADGRLTVGG